MNGSINNDKIEIAFIGDLMLGGEFIQYAEKRGRDFLYPFVTIDPYISDADIVFVNLEGPIFEGKNKRIDVTSILSNHPAVLTWLKRKSGVAIVSLANNHIMDYGAEGLTQTIKKLKDRGINFVGAGINNDEAFKETIFKIKNKSIAFLACTSNEPHVGSIIATHSSEGCASFLNIEKLIEKVKELKKTVDIICISLHWGHELYFYPTSDQVSIARLLLNEGATIIIGHHPHVIQGIEKGNNSLIIYSLGNLFLPNFKNIFGRFELHKPITREFMIIKCVISSEMAITTEIIGGIVNVDYRIIPFQIEKNSEFIKRIEYLSKPFKHKNYESFWFQYKIQRARELSRQELLDAFRKLFKMIFERKLCTISNDDIKRNLCRALNIFPPPKKY